MTTQIQVCQIQHVLGLTTVSFDGTGYLVENFSHDGEDMGHVEHLTLEAAVTDASEKVRWAFQDFLADDLEGGLYKITKV
jgi:hypothetical protein